jgi:hypothetical protein
LQEKVVNNGHKQAKPGIKPPMPGKLSGGEDGEREPVQASSINYSCMLNTTKVSSERVSSG